MVATAMSAVSIAASAGWRWPLESPYLEQSFAAPRSHGFTPETRLSGDRAVHAVAEGEVVFQSDTRSRNRLSCEGKAWLAVDHPDRFRFVYGGLVHIENAPASENAEPYQASDTSLTALPRVEYGTSLGQTTGEPGALRLIAFDLERRQAVDPRFLLPEKLDGAVDVEPASVLVARGELTAPLGSGLEFPTGPVGVLWNANRSDAGGYRMPSRIRLLVDDEVVSEGEFATMRPGTEASQTAAASWEVLADGLVRVYTMELATAEQETVLQWEDHTGVRREITRAVSAE